MSQRASKAGGADKPKTATGDSEASAQPAKELSHDAAYKKFATKGNKEHPLVSILVFIIGTLVGVVPLVIFAQKLMEPIPE